MAKILLVEDDKDVSETVVDALEEQNHAVDAVYSGQDGREFIKTYDYDVIILDWMLPGTTGLELCAEYRKSGGQTPVLMLTGRSEVDEKMAGLDAGADDYLTKPFDVRELVARVRALLRRAKVTTKNTLEFGDIVLDPASITVTKSGRSIDIKPREFALLELFMRNQNTVFDADAIIEKIWSADDEISNDTVRSSIKRLRKLIDDSGSSSCIETIYGMGYKLSDPGASE